MAISFLTSFSILEASAAAAPEAEAEAEAEALDLASEEPEERASARSFFYLASSWRSFFSSVFFSASSFLSSAFFSELRML